MAKTCTTSEGDLLDTLCQHYYGHLTGTVEAVLDANQGLADEAQPFRAGVRILLPELPMTTSETLQLWD
ncbi:MULTISPECIES: tail protein X [unclassified Pseudomonas]|uniref:tail protein X n=1 Tax=unclassified Pseudomonas TaxID=196821 RepID=UPI000C880BD0|nr:MULTISPECIES: tail protein X [unclassified Pseudomonas]MBI6953123.1 tail protein X [Pseudomonas sp. CCOS 191]PNA02897.1 phage tail protein [Pseudomonas sp. FW305-42]PNA27627.1 phage tail protein [Pseudomonas sp. MPR-R1B]PNB29655.1 phage tail protein [Pseudomonas sp. DP16D-E2]PNB45211.1 phage tail protein [Pseudomonas sp. FW305-17]